MEVCFNWGKKVGPKILSVNILILTVNLVLVRTVKNNYFSLCTN